MLFQALIFVRFLGSLVCFQSWETLVILSFCVVWVREIAIYVLKGYRLCRRLCLNVFARYQEALCVGLCSIYARMWLRIQVSPKYTDFAENISVSLLSHSLYASANALSEVALGDIWEVLSQIFIHMTLRLYLRSWHTRARPITWFSQSL